MTDRIEFQATVARVQTMADGGLRFIFDAPETAVMQAAQLMECKRVGAVLLVGVVAKVEDEKPKIGGRLK